MRRRKKYNPFESLETFLIRLAASCVIALVAVQVLVYHDAPRRYLSRVDRLEGDPVTWQTPLVAGRPLVISENAPVASRINMLREHRLIVIRIVQPAAADDVYPVVNGERAGNFKNGEAAVTVYDGDYLEIDASRLPAAGRFVVTVPGGGLIAPLDGLVVEGRGAAVPIGKVKFKH
ncbi:hypothetical protein [Anaeroselena agilis]|uniref:Uncharacterized protein n=1 Tax=Anaeroselena agilis TaxID=3063788 RepID=A0ABU3NWH7_9FIRM|nr:hypothetical protein [Selenomonadales bacterium 4137-cl]